MKTKAVAIDGPSSAGKSTIARNVAERLGYIYVDTGALYRAIGYYASKQGFDTKNVEQVTVCLDKINVDLKYINGQQRVFLNCEDVSDVIRLPEMSMNASNVSSIQAVRDFLFDLQRNMTKSNSIVMDGRDIGTVVLPDADAKIFLTASAEVRARRRYNEYQEKGQKVDFDELLKELIQRDYNDSHRVAAPLKQAEDAILIDTTNDNLEQAVDKVYNAIIEKIG